MYHFSIKQNTETVILEGNQNLHNKTKNLLSLRNEMHVPTSLSLTLCSLLPVQFFATV